MNTNSFQKAQRIIKKARIGICGVAGSGKTLTALKIAQGLGKKIALVDTENNSSVLYADRIDFDVLNIEPPFEVEKYIKAIRQAEAAGYEVLILDSISHAWAGEGGILDTQGKMADGGMNSFTAWRKLTPQHNAFVEAMLRSKLHLIATMRAKMDYVVETNDKGKSVPKKVGLAPVQRDGMDYEFDIVLDLDLNHNALSTKDRSSMFDGKLVTRPDGKIGKQILDWLNHGGQTPPEPGRLPLRTSSSSTSRIGGPVAVQDVLRTLVGPPNNQATVASKRERPPLFDNQGGVTVDDSTTGSISSTRRGEKETAAMLTAIAEATSEERLLSIEQSRVKGLTQKRLTPEQAGELAEALNQRKARLLSSIKSKVA